MNFDFPPFAIVYIFTAGVTIAVAYLAWRRRATPGGLSIALLMLGVTVWVLTAALEIGAVGESAKLFWAKLEYLGVVSSPVLFLIFVLQYTHQGKWLTRRIVTGLWVIPCITLVLVATNEVHHWIWSRTELSPAVTHLLIYYYGPWFWVNTAYAYACIILGTVALIRAIIRFPNAYRQQAGVMLAGVLVPWLGNIIYLFRLNPFPGLDATPITFALTGLLISWGMFQHRLFDLVPVARDALIENLSDGVLVLDAENRIADINPSARHFIGVSTTVIGQPAETALAGWPELARFCCEPQETVAEISTGQETIRYFELHTSFLPARRGHLTGRLLILHDITKRKDAENRLRQLSRAVEQSPASIIITDTAGCIEYMNPKFVEVSGYSFEEARGQNPRILRSGETPPEEYHQLWSTVTSGGEWRGEFHNKRKNGELYWESASISPITNEAGVITHFVAVKEDITERKEAEEALRSSEEQFRQLAENIHDVFWISTPDWSRMLYVSPAYEDLWGCTCESLYEQPMSFLDVVDPQDRQRILGALEKLKSGEPAFGEYRLVRTDGSVGWMRSRIFPIRNESGEVYRAAGITEDITELKRAEEEIRNALKKEQELGEFKSRFVSTTSHEFRTPLSSILGSAELLERYGHKWTEEKKLQHLHKIQASVKNMVQLMDDVLTVGKAEAGKVDFRPAPLDLEQFCRGLIEEMQLQTGANHTLTFASHGQCVDASMDEKLLRHILANLLSNAIKYSPQGGAVELGLGCQAGQAVFRVQDQGIGIPPEAQGHLFDTFHRAENVGNIPGTGLGLSIVKKSVDLHGGAISFTSLVGVGTTFTVVIPLHSIVEEASK